MDMELKKVRLQKKLHFHTFFQNIKINSVFKAFGELQMNKIETSKKIRALDNQIDTMKKQRARYEIIDREVENIKSDDAKVYLAVGRMFVMSSVPEIKQDFKQKKEKVTKVIETCDTTKSTLVKNLTEQETHLRELVDQKKKEGK